MSTETKDAITEKETKEARQYGLKAGLSADGLQKWNDFVMSIGCDYYYHNGLDCVFEQFVRQHDERRHRILEDFGLFSADFCEQYKETVKDGHMSLLEWALHFASMRCHPLSEGPPELLQILRQLYCEGKDQVGIFKKISK